MFGFGKKKKEKVKEEKDQAGCFVGMVLLSSAEWDKSQFISDLQETWAIKIGEEDQDEKYKDIIVTEIGNMRLAISFVPVPVPDQEAEFYAEGNYMWPDAVSTVKKHQAHIMVAVLGDGKDYPEKGRLFTKAVDACLRQKNAVAAYTDGAVFEPGFYRDFAALMEGDAIPVFNLVWFGIYKNGNQIGVYTYGMKKFGKDEMEVYVDHQDADLNDVREFLSDMVSYVLEEDVILNDGETIGFSEEQKLPITKSKGIALDGMSLKIAYN